jgi:hypothetical protein
VKNQEHLALRKNTVVIKKALNHAFDYYQNETYLNKK